MLRKVCKRGIANFDYDVVVIGAGPAGYVSAIKSAQLGFKTACIDKRGPAGGTCLNVGCIPSKSLLNSSYKFYEAKEHLKEHGVTYDSLKLDFGMMMQTKEKAVTGLTKGVEGLFKKNGIDYLKGYASFRDRNTLAIDEKETITANNVVIATGSAPAELPGNILPIDDWRVLSNVGAISLREVPKKMVVIGAGIIGLELGSVYSRLGTEVEVVEYLDRICPAADLDAAQQLCKSLAKQGLKFHFSTKVVGGEVGESGVRVNLEPASDKAKNTPSYIEADYALVAVGRRPFTQGLHLDYIDVSRDSVGRINVNDHLQTLRHANIYAVGDCVRGVMLAHKAEEEGIYAAEHIAGVSPHINYNAIPSVIYTHPELAYVGKSEQQLKEEGIPYTVGSFPYMANSRARANHESEGFVKALAHKETNELLGAVIMGPEAGETINELVLGMQYGAAAEDIARTCHAHPGFSEAIKEACLNTYAKTINF